MRSNKILFLYGAAAVSLSLAYFISPISGETLLQRLTGFEALAQANPVATALVFLAASAALAYLAFPAMPLVYMAAGYCLDSFAGGATVLLGSALGALGAFILYREHMPRRPQTGTNSRSQMTIWLALLGLRLSPIVPAPLVNFFAAFYHVSPVQLMTTTVLGSAPLILFYAQLGRQGHQLLSGAPSFAAVFRISGRFGHQHAIERDGPMEVVSERDQAHERRGRRIIGAFLWGQRLANTYLAFA